MRYDRRYFKMVGLAMLPALALSIVVMLVGKAIGGSDETVERVSQILFFPVFLAGCHYFQRRTNKEAGSNGGIR
jgi:hypothetical protein